MVGSADPERNEQSPRAESDCMLMNTLRFLLPRIMAALLAALFMAGCSVEAKKARLAEQAERDFKSGEYRNEPRSNT